MTTSLWTFSFQDLGGMATPSVELSALSFIYALTRYAHAGVRGHVGEHDKLLLEHGELQSTTGSAEHPVTGRPAARTLGWSAS